jgi:hypothetical protein
MLHAYPDLHIVGSWSDVVTEKDYTREYRDRNLV